VLGRLVALIAVRVKLHGQRPIGLLDLVGVGAARDTQCFVVVLLWPWISNQPLAVSDQRGEEEHV
jgi:hypothetical protein